MTAIDIRSIVFMSKDPTSSLIREIPLRRIDMNRLNERTALIAGGATGIGLTAARRLVEQGALGTSTRVNVLSPRAKAAELAKAALAEQGLKAYGSMTALQRVGAPAEIGTATAFLASSDSSFMTASEVAVEGGLAQL